MLSPGAFLGSDQQAMGQDAGIEPHGPGPHGTQPMSDGGNSMSRQSSALMAESYMPSRLSQGGAAPCQGSAISRSAQHSMARTSTAWCSIAWYGAAWRDMTV